MDNFKIVQGLDSQCDSAAIRGTSEVNQRWTPAIFNGKKHTTKFWLGIDFRHQPMDAAYMKTKLVMENGKKILKSIPTIIPTDSKFLFWTIVVPESETYSKVIPQDEVFTSVEKSGEFPGGHGAEKLFFSTNIKYPKSAHRKKIEGTAYVGFIIERDGKITNVKLIKGFEDECDQEAIRVVSIMPKWKPGMQNGIIVRQWSSLPVRFKLSR